MAYAVLSFIHFTVRPRTRHPGRTAGMNRSRRPTDSFAIFIEDRGLSLCAGLGDGDRDAEQSCSHPSLMTTPDLL